MAILDDDDDLNAGLVKPTASAVSAPARAPDLSAASSDDSDLSAGLVTPESKELPFLAPRGYATGVAPDIGMGILKNVGAMGAHLANLLPGVKLPVPKPASQLEKFSMYGTELASYFAPGLGEEKLFSLLPKLSPVARTIAKAAYDGLTSGLVGTAQTGSASQGAIIGGVSAGISGLLTPSLDYAMEKVGSHIQLRKISPRKLDYDAGFDPDYLKTLDLKGNLRDTYAQIDAKIRDLASQRNALINVNAQPVFTPKVQPRQITAGPIRLGPPSPGEVPQAIISPAGETTTETALRSRPNFISEGANPVAVESSLDAAKRAQQIEVIEKQARDSGALAAIQDAARKAGRPVPTRLSDVYDISFSGPTVDIASSIGRVRQSIMTEINAGRHAGENQQMLTALDQLSGDILNTLGDRTTVPLRYAENAKEALGGIGDFVHQMGRRGAAIPPDATARAEIADKIYLAIRDDINAALPGGRVQELNRQMAKLLPIRRSILKQIPVDDRQAAINAMDLWASIPAVLSGNPAHLALLAAIKAQRSLAVGNWLVRSAQQPSEIAPRLTAGLTSLFLGDRNQNTPLLTSIQDAARKADQPVPYDLSEALSAPNGNATPEQIKTRVEQLKKRYKTTSPQADFTVLDSARDAFLKNYSSDLNP